MPRSSASRGLPSDSRSSVPGELAGVGPDDAGEDLEQRGLAGAVLADERVRLALADGEGHPVERLHGAERLAHVVEFESRHAESAAILLRASSAQ